jgi:hypothetical protein
MEFQQSPTKKKEATVDKQGSSSTKQTVSTSIRTGFSSIQNEPVSFDKAQVFEGFEGSSSIRTGLSGLQESNRGSKDVDVSISARSASMNRNSDMDQEVINQANVKDSELPVKGPAQTFSRFPDTIHEENEAKSVQTFDKSAFRDEHTSCSGSKLKDENTSFSEFKAKSTSTTDESASRYQSGDSSGPISSYSGTGQYTGYEANEERTNDTQQDPGPVFQKMLLPIRTEDGDGTSHNDDNEQSVISHASQSRKSGSWKGGMFGKRVGDAIKNVLAKASPRATPSNHSKPQEERQESRSLFSSVDDEDDIFGGLEDDGTLEDAKVSVPTPKTPKDNAKTPKQKNLKSGNKKDNAGRTESTKVFHPKLLNQTKLDNRRAGDIKIPFSTPNSTANPVTMYSNDRSGMVVDESNVLHNVNSDITSSLIGGPTSAPPNPPLKQEKLQPPKVKERTEEKKEEKLLRSPTSKSKSSRKSKSSKTSSKVSTKSEKEKKNLLQHTLEPDAKSTDEVRVQEPEVEIKEEPKTARSIFMNLSCGFADLSSGFVNLCTPGNKVDDAIGDLDDLDLVKDNTSVSSQSRLTDLEKRVWSEWDRLNGSTMGGLAEDSAPEPKKQTDINKETKNKGKKKEDHNKKREAARDKLLDIASTALSSQLSGKTGNSTNLDGGEENGTLLTEHIISSSETTESGVTKDTRSAESGGSASASGTESGESAGSSSQESGSSTEYSSGVESDFISEDDPSGKSEGKCEDVVSMTPSAAPSAGPILLSFSQRSLMDKFSKQLTAVGVEVLKLNTRKQWQTRYFTVSKEQIALSAHEAISKTGELAHCPKALLWLKKFNPKNDGYGITNIDKDGHGGMLLVDLVDIQVHDAKGDPNEIPIPKKQVDKFKNSVLVTLQYKMNGKLRSIEFRCKDNDEAQFLCTCMRVIRDLLRRERSLRHKSNKLEKMKANTKLPMPNKK